jgi:glycosyltransferase involved in cell wall biosynthesis
MEKSLSVIIPVFNESLNLEKLFQLLLSLPEDTVDQLIVCDDGSSDNSLDVIKLLFTKFSKSKFSLLSNKHNLGKGSTIKKALEQVRCTHFVILDSDLEISPYELVKFKNELIKGDYEVIIGRRKFSSQSSFNYNYVIGNKFISNIFGILFNVYISDVMCGLKLLPLNLFDNLKLNQRRFAIEPELIALAIHNGLRPYEIEIDYFPRSREQGKTINMFDGLNIIYSLIRLRITYRPKPWNVIKHK